MCNKAVTNVQTLLQGARFVLSAPSLAQLPEDRGVEIAFAGQSNTGKSSVINVLCGQRSLARTSRTPGRTQQLIVFDLDENRRLVDLPGFGYAKVSKGVRAHWQRVLPEYLESRRSLVGLIIVMDVRHPLKKQEEVLMDWCAKSGRNAHVLLNKSDKLGKGSAKQTLEGVSRYLRGLDAGFSVQLFSAQKRLGIDEAYDTVSSWLGRLI